MKGIIDTLFDPIIDWISELVQMLRSVSLVSNQPINLDYFLGYVALLGDNWVFLVKNIFLMLMLLTVVWIVTNGRDLIIKTKEIFKFW